MSWPAMYLTRSPASGRINALVEKIEGYNHARAPQLDMDELFGEASEGEELVGGVLGFTYGGFLFIDVLWVHERLRGQGVGGALLALAEEEARQRGCHGAHTDTFTFQALPFYLKHGYQEFARLEGFDGGETRYYLKKALAGR